MAKFLRCLVEIIRTVHIDYWILLMYVGNKTKYLDTYLKEIPRMSAHVPIVSSVILGNDDIVPLTRFPAFWCTERQTDRGTEICRTDILSYPIKEREFTANRRRVPPRAPGISMMPKHWVWRHFN